MITIKNNLLVLFKLKVSILTITFGLVIFKGEPSISHEMWLDTTTFRQAVGNEFQISLKNGQMFEGIELSYFKNRFSEFYYTQDDQKFNIESRMGDRPVAVLSSNNNGLVTGIYVSKKSTITYKFIDKFGQENTLIVSADIENQINSFDTKEKKNYMEMIGLKETGLNMLIKKGYQILELDTYFTSGPEETRAWTIQKNCLAPQAASEIHTDFEKGFIRAETVSYDDFISNDGWVNSKTNGKMRLEGKDYIVKDGDVLNFRFNT